MLMKLKKSNCDDTEKLKLQWHSKTQIVMKLKNSNFEKTKKSQIMMKLKNSNCEVTEKLK